MRKYCFFLLSVCSLVAGAIGYDFSKCEELLPGIVEEYLVRAAEPGSFVPVADGQRRRWANRRARLDFIHINEKNRVWATADFLMATGQRYREMRREHLGLARDPERVFVLTSSLAEYLEAFSDQPDKAVEIELIKQLLTLLEDQPWETRAIEGLIRAITLIEAAPIPEELDRQIDLLEESALQNELIAYFLAMRGDRSVPVSEDGRARLNQFLQAPKLSEVVPYPLDTSRQNRRRTREILKTGIDMATLSFLRERFFERVVVFVDLDKSLRSMNPETAAKEFRAELSQFEFDLEQGRQGWPLRQRGRGWLERLCTAEPAERSEFLAKAKRVARSRNVPPFFRENLWRQILFVEDFGLPIDPFFRHYVGRLGRVADHR